MNGKVLESREDKLLIHFVDDKNICLEVNVPALRANDDVTLGLRPEHVAHVFNGGDITLDLSLDEVESLGDCTNIYAKLFDQLDFRVRLQGQQDLTGTDRLTLYIAPQDILLFDSCGNAIVADTGKTAKPH